MQPSRTKPEYHKEALAAKDSQGAPVYLRLLTPSEAGFLKAPRLTVWDFEIIIEQISRKRR